MTRTTVNHAWVLPEPDETDWDTTLDTWFDELDAALAERTFVEPTPARSRWLIDSSEGWPTLKYDNASRVQQIETETDWFARPFTARDNTERIIGRWEWLPGATIDADLDGRSYFADEADEADEADITEALRDHPVTDFASLIDDRTVTGAWTHERHLTVGGAGLQITGGLLSLPVHDIDDESD